jgi:hypothetical protein
MMARRSGVLISVFILLISQVNAWCGVGVIDFHNHTEIQLPLVDLNVEVQVTANIASSLLKFKYTNPSNETLNVHFKYPFF